LESRHARHLGRNRWLLDLLCRKPGFLTAQAHILKVSPAATLVLSEARILRSGWVCGATNLIRFTPWRKHQIGPLRARLRRTLRITGQLMVVCADQRDEMVGNVR
jgi:hypothetical protein